MVCEPYGIRFLTLRQMSTATGEVCARLPFAAMSALARPPILIAPSVLPADFAKLGDGVAELEAAGVDLWVQGVAWTLPPGSNRIRPLLTNIRQIVAVTTHGSPKWINMLEGEAGKRTVTRALRVLCHRRARSTWLALYGVDRSTAEQRAAFIERAGQTIAALASR